MHKTAKKLLIVLISVVLVIALVGFVLVAFINWVFIGTRFTPEAAIEAVSMPMSQQEYIEAKGIRVYYRTIGDSYDQAGEMYADWPCELYPVIRNHVGMWYAVTRGLGGGPVYPYGSGESVGYLFCEEIDGTYHYFFRPDFRRENLSDGTGPMILPEGLPDDYDTVTVNGTTYRLETHTYFMTNFEVDEFELGGSKYVVENGRNAALIRQWKNANGS